MFAILQFPSFAHIRTYFSQFEISIYYYVRLSLYGNIVNSLYCEGIYFSTYIIYSVCFNQCFCAYFDNFFWDWTPGRKVNQVEPAITMGNIGICIKIFAYAAKWWKLNLQKMYKSSISSLDALTTVLRSKKLSRVETFRFSRIFGYLRKFILAKLHFKWHIMQVFYMFSVFLSVCEFLDVCRFGSVSVWLCVRVSVSVCGWGWVYVCA